MRPLTLTLMSNAAIVWLFVEDMSLVDVNQHRQHSKPIERKLP
jgi:hypothetical protein